MTKRLLILLLAMVVAMVTVLSACVKDEKDKDITETSTNVGVFSLKTPLSGADAVEIQPTLEWGSSKNALKYTLFISKTEDFSDNVYKKDNIASPYHTLSDITLDYSTTYYWKVEAIGRGEGNKIVAANAPLSFSTENDTTVTLNISHLSYVSGENVTLTYSIPTVATSASVKFSKTDAFAETDIVCVKDLANGTLSVPKADIGNGKYFVKVFTSINETVYTSEAKTIFIGNNILVHNFSSETGGTSGANTSVENWSGGTQLNYALSEESLKITYDIGSYGDYIMIHFTKDTQLLSDIKASTYFYIRYKAPEYIGGILLKMRGDTGDKNWKDYTVGNIQGKEEWQETLIEIDTSGVVDLERLSIAIMTSIRGEIYLDDIYFIKSI